MTSFAAKAPDGLRKYFVGLPASGVLFISKFSQDCILDFFTLRIAEFGALQRTANARNFGFVLNSDLVDYCLCLYSIFHVLVPTSCFIVIIRHTDSLLSTYPSSR